MAEIADKSDIIRIENLIKDLTNKMTEETTRRKILDIHEVMKRTGFSKSTIMELVREGKLTPFTISEKKGAKLQFYSNEVDNLVPRELREKYG